MNSRARSFPAIRKLAVLICFLGGWMTAHAQQAPPTAAGEETATIQFPNTPLNGILMEYERLTGLRIIRDSEIKEVTLSIQTSGTMPIREAAKFVEKSLLLNGYALIPSGEDTLKLVSVTGKNPRSEGVPLIVNPEDLPDTDQVVTYLLPLDFLDSKEAITMFEAVLPVHSYGKVTAMPNASAILITENSATVRRYIELAEHADKPPSQVEVRTFELERGDAEQIVDVLTDLLDLESEESQASPGGAASASATAPAPANLNSQTGAAGAEPNAPPTLTSGTAPQPRSTKPKIRPVVRNNTIIAVARPADLIVIESLIQHLDAPRLNGHFVTRKLNYLNASTFLDIAGDSLLRGFGDQEEGSVKGGTVIPTAQPSTSSSGGGMSSSLGGSGGGYGNLSGMGGSRGSSNFEGSTLNSVPEVKGPQSVIIGKMLLIADNVHNELLISGPPEQTDALLELIDQMDRRPPQIQISAVIAQLTLGDDLELGLDLVRTNGSGEDVAAIFRNRTGTLPAVGALDAVEDFLPAAAGLTFYGQITDELSAYVDALQNKTRFKVLARPTIYTLNNRRAEILTGQRIAVPSSTLSTLTPNAGDQQAITSSIQFEEVALRIEVLPLINAANEVTLEIFQINDNIVGSQTIGGNEIPTIGTQKLVTTVIIPDQSTILLGGLISEDDQRRTSGLPVFTSLPLVGPLFGSHGKNVTRRELLIFLQPKIIRENTDWVTADADMKARTNISVEAAPFVRPTIRAEADPVKPRWLQNLFRKPATPEGSDLSNSLQQTPIIRD